jgi:hypothetical protein
MLRHFFSLCCDIEIIRDLAPGIDLGARLGSLEVMASVIVTLYELPGDISTLAIWPFLSSFPYHHELFARLRADLPPWPRILDAVCIIALTFNELLGPELISLFMTPAINHFVTFRKGWFFIPLLLCFQTTMEQEMIQILQFIAGLSLFH